MKSAPLSIRAQHELLAATRWIAADNPAAAIGLREAVANVSRQIGEHPLCGVLRPDLTDGTYRFIKLTGFPYILVYNTRRSPPVIVRLLHGARDLAELLRE